MGHTININKSFSTIIRKWLEEFFMIFNLENCSFRTIRSKDSLPVLSYKNITIKNAGEEKKWRNG